MGLKLMIREMTLEDIPAVVALELKVSDLEGPVAESGVVDSYVSGELGLSCVAEIAGKVVGYILGRLAYTPGPISHAAWIQLIVVHPPHRRQDIGRRLIDRFRERCLEKDARMVHISVPTKDVGTHTFLQRCGFLPAEWTHFSSPA